MMDIIENEYAKFIITRSRVYNYLRDYTGSDKVKITCYLYLYNDEQGRINRIDV